MTDPDLKAQIDALTVKIDAVYESSEKLRKYFKWTLIITVVLFVLPLIGLVFAIPQFLNTYTSQLNSIQ